jgi:uncharacterized protein YndB with AHSA1/START domain
MSDLLSDLNAVHREVGRRTIPAGEARTVVVKRTYDAPIEDVWDAITNPERISRWFLPVSGDLRLGGKYQLEGNAGGEILACDPPRQLKVTWVYGEDTTEVDIGEVEVRLAPVGEDRTALVLEHGAVVDAALWAEFGPGAVGVGWDLTLLDLGLHLRGGEAAPADKAAWMQSPEAREFMTESSNAWGGANRAAGATEADAAAAVANTTAAYAPDPNG